MGLPKLFEGRLRLPAIGAPLFIASGRDLVVEQCLNGIVGAFPALNARPQETLGDWIDEIRERLDQAAAADPGRAIAPFAVNQVMSPLNDRWKADLEVIVRRKAPVIITSLRAPPKEIIDEVHAYGGLVFHDVTNLRHARKAAEAGVDGLILVAAGAGGQGGDRSPFALVNQVREFFGGALLLSGAISTGGDILAAQAMGADMAYLGTRFLAARESAATDEHKAEIIESTADDIVYTNIFTGIFGNYLKSSLKRAGLDPENLPAPSAATAKYTRAPDGDIKVWKDIRGAGQGCGSISKVSSVREIVEQLEVEYAAALRGLQHRAFRVSTHERAS